MKMQGLAGYAALAGVCALIISLACLILTQRRFGDLTDPVKAMAAASAAPAVFYVLNLLLTVANILFLIVLLGLYEHMQVNAPNLTRIALIAGLVGIAGSIASATVRTKSILMIVPTQDISAYRALDEWLLPWTLWEVMGGPVCCLAVRS